MKIRLALALLALLLSICLGCGSRATTFYVAPTYGLYVVRCHSTDLSNDINVTVPLSLNEASALAEKLNNDVGTRWSGDSK